MVPGPRQQRRPRGSAWHWKQTDCWYYTPPGTQRRVPLLDEAGQRIRGKANRQAAELALARKKLAQQWRPTPDPEPEKTWVVARVCSEFIEVCRRRVAQGRIGAEYSSQVVRCLNDLSAYCGALPVAQLKKAHVKHWIESHSTWGPVTQRNMIAIVLAAFNYVQQTHEVPNPLKGLKKPPPRPRLSSLTPADEEALYKAADEPFRSFLSAAVHTGLRPFCELARLTADEILQTPRGMMWRVYSSKTKKSRTIPVQPKTAELVMQLMATAPRRSGIPLFRNSRGTPWKKVTGVARFLAIKRKLGWDKHPIKQKFSCYTARHTFAHRMLSGYWNGGAGCTIETLAELLGDTPKVAFDHYGKEWGQHYQEPLWAAVGLPDRPPSGTSREAG